MTHSNPVKISAPLTEVNPLAEDLSEALSIRDFARDYGHDEALVRQAMRETSVRGLSQGRGRPTLLSVDDQDRLLDHIEGPQEGTEALVKEEADGANLVAESKPVTGPSLALQASGPLQEPLSESMEPAPHPLDHYENPPVQPQNYPAYPADYRRENLEISSGNHRITVETPEIPRAYDLAQFRSEETVPALADPAEVVGQAMAAIDSLVAGMDSDIRQQRNQLAQTQEAARSLRIKAKQLHKKQIEYMIQSSAISQAQQRCTTDLQEALGEVQALGKSPRNEPEPPSS